MKVLLLSSILLAGSPLLAESFVPPEATEVPRSNEITLQLGANVVQKIRADYAAGKYKDFLNEMDKAYAKAKAAGDLEGLIELRATNSAVPSEAFLKGYDAIQEKKSKELLKAVTGQPDSIFVQKVRSSAAKIGTSTEEAALKTLASLAMKAPGTGKNVDENRLIDIDLEYAYKSIHLDSLAANSPVGVDHRNEKQLVLKMVRMDQMAAAASTFEDKALKAQVGTIASHFDERLARSYDAADLKTLARGKVKPTSPLEQTVVSIYTQAHDELAQLHVEEMNAQMNLETTAKK